MSGSQPNLQPELPEFQGPSVREGLFVQRGEGIQPDPYNSAALGAIE